MSEGSTVFDVQVMVGGVEIPKNEVFDLVVQQDLDAPDAASVVLANESTRYSEKLDAGDDLEVKMGHSGAPATTVFKGELVGIEPRYDTSAPRRVALRGFNKLHLLETPHRPSYPLLNRRRSRRL